MFMLVDLPGAVTDALGPDLYDTIDEIAGYLRFTAFQVDVREASGEYGPRHVSVIGLGSGFTLAAHATHSEDESAPVTTAVSVEAADVVAVQRATPDDRVQAALDENGVVVPWAARVGVVTHSGHRVQEYGALTGPNGWDPDVDRRWCAGHPSDITPLIRGVHS